MTHNRGFPTQSLLLRDDGRTVDGRIVPYNEIAQVVEMNQETEQLERYEEQFLPGSFARLVAGVQKRGNGAFIPLLLEHEAHNFDAKIGCVRSMEEKEDGCYATFRLYDSKDLQKIQSMLRESHTGLSVSFDDLRPPRNENGVVSRVQVIINHVAATPIPAYAGAGITNLREQPETLGDTPRLNSVREWLKNERGQ